MLLTVPPLAVGQCWSKPAGRGFHMLTVAATFLITIYCMNTFISSTFQLIGFALFCLLRHLSVLFKVNEECSEGDLCVDRAVEIDLRFHHVFPCFKMLSFQLRDIANYHFCTLV